MQRDEWLAWRHNGIGSSDIGAILGVNPYKSRLEVFLEKTNQIKPKDLSKNFAVQRGIILEPIARKLVNERKKTSFVAKNFTHQVFDFMKYSSDGFDSDLNMIIEIKCMGESNHNKVLSTKEIIPYYYPQVQWGLMISQAELALFVSYTPTVPENLVILEILPDQEFFNFMTKEAILFWGNVLEYKRGREEIAPSKD